MLTLAFDTTAKIASCAAVKDGRVLAEYTVDNGLTQSELLLPMAKDMLGALKISIEDVDLLACSVGPGSFTGVRIGVSLVKGLAFERQIPTVAVSTLEALAQNLYPLDGVIVPVMDARRAQVYTALFTVEDGELKRLSPDEAMLPLMQTRPTATMTTAAIVMPRILSPKSRGENSRTSIGPA